MVETLKRSFGDDEIAVTDKEAKKRIKESYRKILENIARRRELEKKKVEVEEEKSSSSE